MSVVMSYQGNWLNKYLNWLNKEGLRWTLRVLEEDEIDFVITTWTYNYK